MNEIQPKRILLVDDEANILSAVQRELKTPPLVHYSYDITSCTSPLQALAIAREQAFDLVVSDYRMPEMDGIAFLATFREIQPDCPRIVLSGQTDMSALMRMVNETHVYRFIPKPWHDYYLKGSVVQALDYSATLNENKRLADLVRQHGITLPDPEESPIDQILIVDDDPGVLASLARVLTHHTKVDDLFAAIRAEVAHARTPVLQEGLVSVQVTPSPRHALQTAEKINFSCIIADYKMPEMTGIDLLQRFSEIQPECERILISGQISEKDLIYAVDSAHIFAFVDKPWSDYDLKSCVALALAHRKLLLDNQFLAEMVRKSGHSDVP